LAATRCAPPASQPAHTLKLGGAQGLYGALAHYASEPLRARSLANGTLAGLGLAMEGMYQNEIVYELTLDVPWQTSVIDVEQWLSKWVARRYGSQPSVPGAHLVQQPWATLAYVLSFTFPLPVFSDMLAARAHTTSQILPSPP
jgi:hypothetical protein